MNIFITKLLYFFIGIFSSGIILFLAYPKLKKYILDKPNTRSLHIKPIPSAGGISFTLPIIFLNSFQYFMSNYTSATLISIYCIPLAIISFVDDLIKVSSKYRYCAQILCTLIIIFKLNYFPFELNVGLNLIFLIFLIIFITALINFTNFMDGSDGLVGLNMLVFFIILIKEGSTNGNLFLLIGSLITFIYWNWQPAKIFMGDVGSTFLGIYFAANLLEIESLEKILGVLLITFPLYVDALFTLLKRLTYKQNIFVAHRSHLYQRLFLGGLQKSRISIIYTSLSIFIGIVYYNLGIYAEIISVFLCGIFMLMLNKYYATPFGSAVEK